MLSVQSCCGLHASAAGLLVTFATPLWHAGAACAAVLSCAIPYGAAPSGVAPPTPFGSAASLFAASTPELSQLWSVPG